MRRVSIVFAILLLAAGCVPEENLGGDSGFVLDSGQSTADGFTDDAVADIGADDAQSSDVQSPDTADPGPDIPPIPEEGPYNVGYMEMDVEYQAKEDKNPDKRKLNVSIWYPTEQKSGPPARYSGVFRRDEVVSKAKPAPINDLPVLIFSHGNGGIAEQNYFMSELWATRGWVIVSPDHTGNTAQDGTDINLKAAIYRPQDITAVLDEITNLPKDHRLAGKLSDDIAMSGHSFGALTTLMNSGAEFAVDELLMECNMGMIDPQFQDYCDIFSKGMRPQLFKKGFYDDRIKVGIPQAPAGAIVFKEGLAELKVPTMLMTGGKDRTLPNHEQGDPIWQYMKGDEHRRLNLPKAGHFTFSNMCDLFGSVEQVKNDGCGMDFIDVQRAYDIINTYSLAYARYHLFDDPDAKEIIDGDRHPVGKMGFELSVGAD